MHYDVVNTLISYGADINQQESKGLTPLFTGKTEIIFLNHSLYSI